MIYEINGRNVAIDTILKGCAFLVVSVLLASPIFAAELRALDIDYRSGRYTMNVDSYIQAPVAAVYKVLTDYDRFELIAEGIKEARILKNAHPNLYLVYTKVAACIPFMCIEKEKIERIELRSRVEIFATVIPEHSDFKYGVTHWIVASEGEGTHLRLKMEIEPNFWIPPIIGPRLFMATMRKEGIYSMDSVEQLANDIVAK